MILDGRSWNPKAPHQATFLVVGAGPAGITLALRLAAAGKKVTMIEAGSFDYDAEIQNDYNGQSTGLPYSLEGTRLRQFGGTSNHWAGMCAPLDPEDFNASKATEMPHPGWPISYEDLLPHYKKAAQVLEIPEFFTEDFRQTSKGAMVDLSAVGLETKVWAFRPTRFGKRYAKTLALNENIQVLTRTALTDIQLNNDSGHCRSVTVIAGERKHTINCDHLILACGGIENARLLLHCDKQVASGIGNDSGNLGDGFMEHFHFYQLGQGHFRVPGSSYNFYRFNYRTDTYGGMLQLSPSLRHKLNLPNAVLMMHTAEEPTDRLAGAIIEARQSQTASSGFNDSLDFSVGLMAEQRPGPSRITLSDERDRLGMRRASINWEAGPEELASCAQSVDEITRRLSASGHARFRIDTEITDTTRPGFGSHHIGTTRMAASDKFGVVDVNCALFAHANIFMAGSSVMPTGGCANPTFTLVALADRLADYLARNS